MPCEKEFVDLLRGIAGDDYLVFAGSGYIAVTEDNAALTLFVHLTRERVAMLLPSRLALAVLSSRIRSTSLSTPPAAITLARPPTTRRCPPATVPYSHG